MNITSKINPFSTAKRLLIVTVRGVGLGVGIAMASTPVMAQEVTLKLHHIWPTTAMYPKNMLNQWCDKIAADSANRMKCQMLPAMSGGGTPPQLVDRVKDGVDDMVVTLPGYTPGRFPIMEAFELPFMTSTAEAASKASWDYFQKNAVKEFPGTKVLAIWVHDEGYIHNNKQPIKTLADFKGMKLRAPTRQVTKLLSALGASPVGMPIPTVADAISKGTIDGAVIPWEAVTGFRITETVKYHTETPQSRPAMYSAVFVWGMNQAKYDSLPADLKAVIDKNSGMALSAASGKLFDESQAPSRKIAADRKNEIYVLPVAETDNWIKASESVYADWVVDMDKRGQNGKALLQDARDLLVKYNKK